MKDKGASDLMLPEFFKSLQIGAMLLTTASNCGKLRTPKWFAIDLMKKGTR